MVHIEDVGCVEHDIIAGGSGAGSGRRLSLGCMYSGESQDEDERSGCGARRSEHGPNTSTPGRQFRLKRFAVHPRPPGAPDSRPFFVTLTWVEGDRHRRALLFRHHRAVRRVTAPTPQPLHSSLLFHHIFLVRPSQTCSPIGAKIPRQCTIENCASLQRRTHFRSQTFHRYLTTYGQDQHPRKCTPNRKIKR